ncbi:arylsulfatase [Lentisphaera marina]|uniref:arylsulfatase n=1 Tax=Lentisphaera marina TaxID=1111041 RepID=UPI0023654121|nr:arylsulfatase [Lentisphaera marina]MDD7986042.1 arylsulfatase [Lentisphaera marina]
MKKIIVFIFFLASVYADSAKPNIIVFLSDDQGWGDLSINGNKDISTPHIDSLAQDGALFENFYVQPVCSPTRAEFLTGRYAFRSGVQSTSEGGERFNLDEQTIADVFRQAAYATAAFGKWHSGMQYPYHPNGRGFDEFYGFCSGHWGNYYSPMLEHNGKIVKGEGFCVDDFTERAMAFMEANKEKPFFVYLPYNTPHTPMQVPSRFWDKFSSKKLSMKNSFNKKSGHGEDFVKAALAMCENIDWNVGRVLNKLDDLNIAENTIVLYFSDNGPNSLRWNGNMKGKKGSTDEGGVRSPLHMRWPRKIKPQQRIKEVTGAIDLLATLSSLAGVEFQGKKQLDGLDFSSLLIDKKREWDEDRMLLAYWKGKSSLRSQNYRLDTQGKLYDMRKDRQQKNDLSKQLPETQARLQSHLNGLLQEVSEQLPAKDQRPFLICHENFEWTQIPARDGHAHGGIKRSNRWPNCSFFTNWTSLDDRIIFDAYVQEPGTYELEIYYTCPKGSEGSEFKISFGKNSIKGKIIEAHDPPLFGMNQDRSKRAESYVKNFKRLNLGQIELNQGAQKIEMQALKIVAGEVMDFRLLMLRRVEQ